MGFCVIKTESKLEKNTPVNRGVFYLRIIIRFNLSQSASNKLSSPQSRCKNDTKYLQNWPHPWRP